MRHEVIIKRDDGSQVQIVATISIDHHNVYSDIQVAIKGFRKRTWIYVTCGDDYTYRALSMKDRKTYYKNLLLNTVTADEIYKTECELWQKLKPKLVNHE